MPVRPLGATVHSLVLTDYGLSSAFAERIEARLGGESTVDALSKLASDPRFQKTDDYRPIRNVLDRVLGISHHLGSIYVAQTDAGPLPRALYFETTGKLPVHNEPAELERLRHELNELNWGQPDAGAAFAKLEHDFRSPGRRQPPVLVISGLRGHGKDEAIKAYLEHGVGTERAPVIADCAGVTDKAYEDLFGEQDGVLSAKVLRQMAADGAPVVLLRNMESLETRAPLIARRLKELLQADVHSEHYAHVRWIVDFDTVGSPNALMLDALGLEGPRVISAKYESRRLQADTMLRYAFQLLPVMKAAAGFEELHLQFEPAALDVLGRILEPPDEPRYELEFRLYRAVMSHLALATNVNPTRDLVTLQLNPKLTEADIGARVQALLVKGADLESCEDLFVLDVTGRKPLASLPKVLDTIPKLLALTKGHLAELKERAAGRSDTLDMLFEVLNDEIAALGPMLAGARERAEVRMKSGLVDVLLPSEARALNEHVEMIATCYASCAEEAHALAPEGPVEEGVDRPQAAQFRARAELAHSYVNALMTVINTLSTGELPASTSKEVTAP